MSDTPTERANSDKWRKWAQKEVSRCGMRSKKGCIWGSHKCARPKGHTGKHRCGLMKDGTMTKFYKQAIPCNKTWEQR